MCLVYPCQHLQVLVRIPEVERLALGPGGLKGVFTTGLQFAGGRRSAPRKTGVDKEMGSGVGPEGGVGNSRIRSGICFFRSLSVPRLSGPVVLV